jgi:heme exporter protein C
MNPLNALANPTRFKKWAGLLLPFAATGALLSFAAGIYYALFASPPDYQQGETVRIMYVHVPAAWFSMAVYAAMALAAVTGFVWRHTLADIFCRAAAPVGAGFALICLVTGSLWGKPMWGAWWVWDARLTSMLILFFLYIGYMALRGAFEDPVRGEKAGQILLVAGAINLPVIKFSVEWWNTLHQGETVFRKSGSGLDESMALPLAFMAAGYFLFAAAAIAARMLTLMEHQRRSRV